MNYRIDGFRLVTSGKKVLASADITLYYTRGDIFLIHGVKLIQGRSGLFITMPTNRIGDKFRAACEILDANIVKKLRADMIQHYRMQTKTEWQKACSASEPT